MSATFAPTRHKLSVEDYHKLGDAGVLTEDSRVELVDGELIDMAPIGSLHASVVSTLSMFFARHVGDRAIVSTQNPVILPPDSEPQPDIALLKPSADRYRNALPTASDVLLIIEVADTTLDYDRTIKLPRYAAAKLFAALADALASEQAARLIAMGAARKNAGSMGTSDER